MPRKVRQLIRDLEAAGFVSRGGKDSHRKFTHPWVTRTVVLSGNEGDDAQDYQEKLVRKAVAEAQR